MPIENTDKNLRLRRVSFRLSGDDVKSLTRKILAALSEKRGMRVMTLNWEMVALGLEDSEYERIAFSSDLIFPDGWPVKLWARMRGIPAVKTSGIDLTAELLRACHAAKEKIAIIGSNTVASALDRLRLPQDAVTYHFLGKLEMRDAVDFTAAAAEVAQEIKNSGARMVFLAMGVPKQDWLAWHFSRKLSDAVFIPVGGSFDVLSQLKPRAPKILVYLGLEWFWRFALEPKRLFTRYFIRYPIGLARFARSRLTRS